MVKLIVGDGTINIAVVIIILNVFAFHKEFKREEIAIGWLFRRTL